MGKFICSVDLCGGSETDKLEASETMSRQEESMAMQVWTWEGAWSGHQQAALFALTEQTLEL